jgi:hypothetical protein
MSTTWLCPAEGTHKTQPRPQLATTKLPNALLNPTNSALPLHEQPPPLLLPPSTTPTSTLSTNSIQPVLTHNNPPPTQPSQPYAFPGDICTTILHASRNKGAGVNADSIDIFDRPRPSKHQLYLNKSQLYF